MVIVTVTTLHLRAVISFELSILEALICIRTIDKKRDMNNPQDIASCSFSCIRAIVGRFPRRSLHHCTPYDLSYMLGGFHGLVWPFERAVSRNRF